MRKNERQLYAVLTAAASIFSGISKSNVAEIPLVESFRKTKEAVGFLRHANLWDDIEKMCNSKKLRAGKGKARNRRFNQKLGPVIVGLFIFSRQGKLRLQKWYTAYQDKSRICSRKKILPGADHDDPHAQAEDVGVPRVQGPQDRQQTVRFPLVLLRHPGERQRAHLLLVEMVPPMKKETREPKSLRSPQKEDKESKEKKEFEILSKKLLEELPPKIAERCVKIKELDTLAEDTIKETKVRLAAYVKNMKKLSKEEGPRELYVRQEKLANQKVGIANDLPDLLDKDRIAIRRRPATMP